MSHPTKIGILFSGSGSNMQTLAGHIAHPDVPADLVLTISNRPNAGGIGVCQENNIPCTIIDHKDYETRAAFEAQLDKTLRQAGIEFICAAGFMRLLTSEFVGAWQGRIINIHPALLPKFKGLNTHQRVIDAAESDHGCTVHYMQAEMDEGAVLVQRRIAVLADDTADTLAARVLVEEHQAFPEALDLALENLRKI